MSEKDSVVAELKSAAVWFTQHGRNTNTAIIGICKRAIDLINRQQAEIERLTKCRKEEVEKLMSAIDEVVTEAKSEAIKEFSERLKEKQQSVKARFSFGGEYISNGVMCSDIDDLVTEMVGDKG